MPLFSIETTYLEMAHTVSKRSYAERKKVGAIIANEYDILSYGWNGMPPGYDNCCETKDGKTNPLVFHAEANAILKCAKSGKSIEGASLYQTLSPCLTCAQMIYRAGITKVYYTEEYRLTDGIDFLKELDISCIHYTLS